MKFALQLCFVFDQNPNSCSDLMSCAYSSQLKIWIFDSVKIFVSTLCTQIERDSKTYSYTFVKYNVVILVKLKIK